ncbi:PPK2 family polyphosphate kinase [Pseudonocardia sp.]|uniref:PPK2 family polyphosphate kinase n=1 Tax=Pseudonocardia sp. TaxID=60912 RepID=UPI003D0D126A
MSRSVRAAFRVTAAGPAGVDPRDQPVGPKDRGAAGEELAELGPRLAGLQERLYAEGSRSVLLVLQGMDTSGKGGVVEHVAGLVNPQGLAITSFKKPTEAERAEHYLARIRRAVPRAGYIGVFDRSHYEDVLVVRVDALVPENVWRPRYEELVAFEAELTAAGVTVVKCMLHISPGEQQERLLARLDDPTKHWKYHPGDVDVRAKWPAYREAYAEALRRTDTDAAPWYVIPADRKWYRNWAIATLLHEVLVDLDPRYPPADFDVEVERARVVASVVA